MLSRQASHAPAASRYAITPWHMLPEVPFIVGLVPALSLIAYAAYLVSISYLDYLAGRSERWFFAAAVPVVASVTLLGAVRMVVLFGLACSAARRQMRTPSDHERRLPLVSILIPAYNEERTIRTALESLVQLDYPTFEIIVIDDGSTDGTLEEARGFQGNRDRCNLHVLHKPNGGKWSALNLGFRHARGEAILCVDADSILHPAALRLLVRRLRQPDVSAVAGQVRVRNRNTWLTMLQSLEYVIANGLSRMAQGLSATVMIVPGPLGLFRRSMLREVMSWYGGVLERARPGSVPGPYESDTVCEDFDLSLAILSMGGRIVYEPAAVSFTKAPDWVFALLNQRYRWVRGSVQVLRKQVGRMLASPEGWSKRLMAWLAISPILETFILPLANVLSVSLAVAYIATGGSIVCFLGLLLGLVLVDLNIAMFGIVTQKDSLALLKVLPLLSLYFFLLNIGWCFAVVDELRGTRMRW